MDDPADSLPKTPADGDVTPDMVLHAASRAKADAYLEEQTRLARLQSQNLIEQNAFELSHLRVRRFGDYSRMALELLIALLVLTIVIGLAAMIVNARGDRDLVFDELSVPPDLAARGITGKVISAQLLDHFARIQDATTTMTQDAESFRSGAGGNIRIAIPNTGISIGELNQYFRDWLGQETHVSGEVVRTTDGLAITVRMGQQPGVTFTGSEQTLAALLHDAAQSLYAQALPLRYADFLAQQGRYDEALAMLKPLSQFGTAQQRAAALASWSELTSDSGDPRTALELSQEAARLAANTFYVQWVLADGYGNLGHEQQHFETDAVVVRLGQSLSGTVARDAASGWLFYQALGRQMRGDFSGAKASIDQLGGVAQVDAQYGGLLMIHKLFMLVAVHDGGAARVALSALPSIVWTYPPAFNAPWATMFVRAGEEDWQAVAAAGARAVSAGANAPRCRPIEAGTLFGILPLQAVALAHLGEFSRARSVIGPTALDCDSCVRARGRIAALQHDWRAAAHWFSVVDARSPSIPFAAFDWGAMLLRKGDLDGAIAKFAIANQKGPHFADPLELWGEALIAKNRSDLALAKFEEASRYAPNWGRLHLKWGEALAWLGRKADAKAQFAIASHLDLSAADGAELSRMEAVHV